MENPPIISLTDCCDANAVARQSARLAALFGQAPAVLPLGGTDPEGFAALTLLDTLRATDLAGGAARPVAVLVNIAPRDGLWPNGAPFCYFRHEGNLVVSTFNPRVLAPLRRYLGVEKVEVTDVREVVEAAAARWARFTADEVDQITATQFRSLWYVPLLARWLVDERPLPSTTTAVPDEADAGDTGDTGDGADGTARVAVVDNFGNCKLDVPAAAIAGYRAGEPVEIVSRRDGRTYSVRCFGRLPEVPHGEPGLTTGSSGFGFAELVVRGGSAAEHFGLREGDRVLRDPAPAGRD